MGGFRRFLYIIYFVISVITVGALAISWYDFAPLAQYVNPVLDLPWAKWTLLGGLAVVAVGLIVVLIKAIFTKSKKSKQVSHTALGDVRITKHMFEDCVESVVTRHPELEFVDTDIIISNGSNPKASIDVVVIPHEADSLSGVAASLQEEIKAEVERLTGNPVTNVCVDFKAGSGSPLKQTAAQVKAATEAKTAEFAQDARNATSGRPQAVEPAPIPAEAAPVETAPMPEAAPEALETAPIPEPTEPLPAPTVAEDNPAR